jgi:anti-anti-sigma factor
MGGAWRSSVSVEGCQETGTLVLRLCGELDLAGRNLMEPAILAAIPTADAVVLDLSELTFCGAAGVAMLVAAREKADAEGTLLSVRNVLPVVRHVFEISGIDAVIESRNDLS